MMPIFERLRLVPRLVLAFGLVLLVMSTGAVLGMWRLQSLEAVADELGGNAAQRALLARELQAIVVLSASRAETLLQIDDPAFAARIDADRKLTSARSEVVRKTLDALAKKSPTMLKVSLEQIRRGAKQSLAECFRMELELIHGAFEHGDFIEGIRALIVEKDNQPRWKAATLAQADDATVKKFFGPRWKPADHPLHAL